MVSISFSKCVHDRLAELYGHIDYKTRVEVFQAGIRQLVFMCVLALLQDISSHGAFQDRKHSSHLRMVGQRCFAYSFHVSPRKYNYIT
jgi:hypothetical protein